MVFPKVVSGLLIASLSLTSCWGQFSVDYGSYDGSYDGSYRGAEPEYEEPRSVYRGDDVPAASVERASPAVAPHAPYALHSYAPAPAYDAPSYRLYHRDSSQVQAEPLEEGPQEDHKHHHGHSHDHGTSSMSFYQKVKHHDFKFKLEQKHGKKHGTFHGLAHPYAYGGLKVHDF